MIDCHCHGEFFSFEFFSFFLAKKSLFVFVIFRFPTRCALTFKNRKGIYVVVIVLRLGDQQVWSRLSLFPRLNISSNESYDQRCDGVSSALLKTRTELQ